MTKIRLRLGQAEVEVEAEPERLKEAIDLIPELASKLGALSPGPARVQNRPAQEGGQAAGASAVIDIPQVTLEKRDSLSDVISKFFSDDWGRERRKLSDVREALQSYGLNYPKQSVAVALLRLAKTTRIRRFKAEDGEYVYTSAGGVEAPLPEQGEPLEAPLDQTP